MQMRYLLLVYIILLGFYSEAQSIEPSQPLTVGVAGSPPFVLHDPSRSIAEGISIQVWERVSKELNLNYRYQYFSDVPEALEAMQKDQLDVVVGPTTITSERAAFV